METDESGSSKKKIKEGGKRRKYKCQKNGRQRGARCNSKIGTPSEKSSLCCNLSSPEHRYCQVLRNRILVRMCMQQLL